MTLTVTLEIKQKEIYRYLPELLHLLVKAFVLRVEILDSSLISYSVTKKRLIGYRNGI